MLMWMLTGEPLYAPLLFAPYLKCCFGAANLLADVSKGSSNRMYRNISFDLQELWGGQWFQWLALRPLCKPKIDNKEKRSTAYMWVISQHVPAAWLQTPEFISPQRRPAFLSFSHHTRWAVVSAVLQLWVIFFSLRSMWRSPRCRVVQHQQKLLVCSVWHFHSQSHPDSGLAESCKISEEDKRNSFSSPAAIGRRCCEMSFQLKRAESKMF